MKERPILFNGEMVKALLDGRKTQTRRIVKPRQLEEFKAAILLGECSNFLDNPKQPGDDEYLAGLCPKGAVGDVLYVKETHFQWGYWVVNTHDDSKSFSRHGDKVAMYMDSPPTINVAKNRMTPEKAWHKRPSLFMPKWASRAQLKITNIRVERVRDISETDAKAEGVGEHFPECPQSNSDSDIGCNCGDYSYAEAFQHLWDSINAKKAPWKSNLFVWVIEFKVL